MASSYNKHEIVECLKNLNISKGDILFSHSNIGFLGKLESAKNSTDYYSIFKDAIFEVIGPEGTWIVPTFSYSFCKGNNFDLNNTPGTCGILSEELRKDPESVRSEDANFSVSAIGEKAIELTSKVSSYSFGPDSFFDRFYQQKGKILNINFDSGSTFVHYVERELNVPYRFDKGFEGLFINKSISEGREYFHFCYDLNKPDNIADFTKIDKIAKSENIIQTSSLGRGSLLSFKTTDMFKLIKKQIKINPAILVKGLKLS